MFSPQFLHYSFIEVLYICFFKEIYIFILPHWGDIHALQMKKWGIGLVFCSKYLSFNLQLWMVNASA